MCNDLDQPLSDDVLNQLAEEDALTEEFVQLSLHAIDGVDTEGCLKLHSLVQNKVMLTLVDFGSTTSFVNASFLHKLGIVPEPCKPIQVKVANGEVVLCDKMVYGLEWWCQGHTFCSNMRVLDLGAYDSILGYDWLSLRSPMKCDWTKRTMEFVENGKTIQLQGVLAAKLELSEIHAEQLVKWCQGNEVWAMGVVELAPAHATPNIPSAVQQILEEYKDVFGEPKELPPIKGL